MAKKVKEYSYEKFQKYKKRFNFINYSKKEWEEMDDFKKKLVYENARSDYYWFPIFYTFLGLIFVGGIVGGIVYGVWIDDILQGILLALGFPIFIIAGFFGAGKGL